MQAAASLQAVARAAAEADRDREVEARRAAWERAVATLKAQQKAAADEVLWPHSHVGPIMIRIMRAMLIGGRYIAVVRLIVREKSIHEICPHGTASQRIGSNT